MKRTLLPIAVILALAVILTWDFTPRAGAGKSKRQPEETQTSKIRPQVEKERLIEKFVRNQPPSGRKARFTARGWSASSSAARKMGARGEDPDVPSFVKESINKKDYLRSRARFTARLRGYEPGKPFDINARIRAIKQMEQQERLRAAGSKPGSILRPEVFPDWEPIGPAPIPNGQTSPVNAVSGRVTAIDIHPTNPNIAYAGTAQGGLYRTLDGGTTWTQLMSTAQSLAIGAVTIDPITPTIVFVGTGESNLSLDSFWGVGIYRINNADTTPVVNGPFQTRVAGTGTGASDGNAFNRTSISRIVVDPANDNRIFVGNTYGGSGIGGLFDFNSFSGLWFSGNALAATPVFSRVGGLPGGGNGSVTDIVFEPGSSNNMIVAQYDLFSGCTVPNCGIFRTTNAGTASQAPSTSPTFALSSVAPNTAIGVDDIDIRLAINKVGSNVTVIAARALSSGSLLQSSDGGVTFPTALPAADGFCGGQCFYDLAVAIDPGNANNIYIGGSAEPTAGNPTQDILQRSTDGGTTFQSIDPALHADSHAITIAPSNPAIAYTGNDGGVWKSLNVNTPTASSVAWTNLNTATFSATQFMSIAVHGVDPDFTIGGTQDNGTPCFGNCGGNTPATWTRADFGDGGFAAIDQNATDTTTVTMYHTYFNQTNGLIGYARVLTTACAVEGEWSFKGIYGGPVDPTVHCDGSTDTFNGITITDDVNFYAPLTLGPGNPNTVYFGSDRLYRSANRGDTVSLASQAPLVSGQPISAIAISPQDDNYRLVGLNNGALFFTTTGSATLTVLDAVAGGSVIPDFYIGRVAFDPTDKNTAYVTLNDYTGSSNHVWRITNLNTTPVKTSINGSGALLLPDVPVNAFAIDPLRPSRLLAGTDIGVYISEDSGATWNPYGGDLPRVAVFGMAITSGRLLRVATHGLGMWQIPLFGPTAAPAMISGSVATAAGTPLAGVMISLQGDGGQATITDSNGHYQFDGVDTGNFYTVTPSLVNYRFSPANRSFSLVGNQMEAAFTAAPDAIVTANAIDSTEYFVRQQYVDFLGREPDQGGFQYWSNQINQCGSDAACIRGKRTGVSAAFFIEAEFQQTGSFIYRLYKSALGRHLSYLEFISDRGQLRNGPDLEATKAALADAFVQRAEFIRAYQSNTTPGSFVDALLRNVEQSAGLDLSSQRNSLIARYETGAGINQSRSLVVKDIAENAALARAVYNKAFVLMQYFGYLRRDPDQGGYDFWLDVVSNRDVANYRSMVCAFISSAEYQRRFGSLVTRTDSDCGR